MSNNELKDFGKPTGEWTTENVPVQKINFDPDTKKITNTYTLEKQKVMYIHAPKEKTRCKQGEHNFKCVDNRKYVFSCTKCPYSRQVYPIKYIFKDNQLIDKTTGRAI